jgi:hypothetical protein
LRNNSSTTPEISITFTKDAIIENGHYETLHCRTLLQIQPIPALSQQNNHVSSQWLEIFLSYRQGNKANPGRSLSDSQMKCLSV